MVSIKAMEQSDSRKIRSQEMKTFLKTFFIYEYKQCCYCRTKSLKLVYVAI